MLPQLFFKRKKLRFRKKIHIEESIKKSPFMLKLGFGSKSAQVSYWKPLLEAENQTSKSLFWPKSYKYKHFSFFWCFSNILCCKSFSEISAVAIFDRKKTSQAASPGLSWCTWQLKTRKFQISTRELNLGKFCEEMIVMQGSFSLNSWQSINFFWPPWISLCMAYR